jgi:hypothetical protein
MLVEWMQERSRKIGRELVTLKFAIRKVIPIEVVEEP